MMSMQQRQVDYQTKWNNSIHIFGLKIAHKIFSLTEQFSTNLQAVDITIQEALNSALLVSHLKSLRTETMFNRFYDSTVEESGSFD